MSARFLPILRQRREPRPNRNDAPEYLNFIRSQSCVICARQARPQFGRTEAAHVGIRGMGQKCSDWEAIPLCACHHRTGEFAHHRMGKKFWVFWKLDRYETIQKYQSQHRASCALLEHGHAEVA